MAVGADVRVESVQELVLPLGATSVLVNADRSGIPDDGQWGHIELIAELSLDDGKTWGNGCFVDESDGQVPLAFSLMFGVTSSIYSPDVKSTGFDLALPPVANTRLRITKRIAEGLATPDVTTEFGFSPSPKRQLLKDVHHSVAFGAAQTVSGLSGASGFTVANTASGSNRLVLVGYGFVVGVGSTVATITYGGVSMTRVGTDATRTDFNGGTFTGFAGLWQLVAPATGSQTVILTASGGGTLFGCAGICSYTGVDQTTPVGTPVSANGSSTTASADVTGTSSGNAVFASLLYDAGSGIPSPNNTGRYLDDNAGTGGIGFTGGGQDAAGGGSITSSWTKATSKPWAVLAVEILQFNPTVSFTLVKGDLALSGKVDLLTSVYAFVKGDLALSGYAAALTNILTIAKGDLILAGQAAFLGQTVFNLAKGDLALSGKILGLSTGGVNITLPKGDLALSGKSIIIGSGLIRLLAIAPYAPSDTIGTKQFTVYDIQSGAIHQIGSTVTSGFNAIPNITNGWWVSIDVLPNNADGSFSGFAVFDNINGSGKHIVELYSPPTSTPSSLSIVKKKEFASADTITTVGYQLYDQNGQTLGGHVTNGSGHEILAVSGVTKGYVTLLSLTPDSAGGFKGGVLWDSG